MSSNTSERHHVVPLPIFLRKEWPDWRRVWGSTLEGEAKQLKGDTDGKLLCFKGLIYRVAQNSLDLDTINDSD
jgi:hypothetical protein